MAFGLSDLHHICQDRQARVTEAAGHARTGLGAGRLKGRARWMRSTRRKLGTATESVSGTDVNEADSIVSTTVIDIAGAHSATRGDAPCHARRRLMPGQECQVPQRTAGLREYVFSPVAARSQLRPYKRLVCGAMALLQASATHRSPRASHICLPLSQNLHLSNLPLLPTKPVSPALMRTSAGEHEPDPSRKCPTTSTTRPSRPAEPVLR